MDKFYSGIGSRETPKEVLEEMKYRALWLDLQGYTLRSGGAEGADQAFESGTLHRHVYLPWKGFAGNTSDRFPAKPEAFEIASKYHPAWSYLKQGAKALHARNVHQVLGDDLKTPSEFVLCWTPDGAESASQTSKKTGGTGGAIRIADAMDIPIVNMKNEGWLEKLLEIING